MERAAARFGRNTEKSFKRASRSASRFSDITKGIVAGLGISRGISLLTQGISSVTTQFIAFDKAALGAAVRFKDIGPRAADFKDRLKEIEQAARDAGATTEFTAAQSANALDFLARAGFKSAEGIGSLVSMINLATATGEDFEKVADISSDLLGAFGLNADNTAQKIKNLNRLNDVLVTTVNSANVTMEDLFDTMKTVGPIATGILGASVEEVAALTGVLGSSGIKGTQAMTALKNIFLRLAAPTSKARKVLSGLKIEMLDIATGEPRKMTDVLEELGQKIQGLGKLKKAEILDVLFGKFAIAGGANLAANIAQIRELNKATDDAGDTARLTAEIMRTSLEAKLLTLSSAATEFGFKILQAFRGDAKGGIDAMTESIRKLDVTGIVAELKVVIKFMGILLKVAGGVATAFDKIGTFIGTTVGKLVVADLFKTAGGESFSIDDLISGGDVAEPPSRIGPNQQEAAAKAQFPGFQGQLNIAGAPEGSTVETKSAPPGFSVALLGQN